MKKHNRKKERGAVEVEATVILPIAILSVILLLYLSLYMYQRANLQACLETTLVYFKNIATDNYISKEEKLTLVESGNTVMAGATSYAANAPLNPYEKLFGDVNDLGNQESFETFFYSIAGDMLFDENLTLAIDYSNYVIFKQLEVTATQTIDAPIDFRILGVPNQYMISATARVNVVDHDDMIRNVDYAIDIVEDTKLGDLAANFAAKVKEGYGKMKSMLGL